MLPAVKAGLPAGSVMLVEATTGDVETVSVLFASEYSFQLPYGKASVTEFVAAFAKVIDMPVAQPGSPTAGAAAALTATSQRLEIPVTVTSFIVTVPADPAATPMIGSDRTPTLPLAFGMVHAAGSTERQIAAPPPAGPTGTEVPAKAW